MIARLLPISPPPPLSSARAVARPGGRIASSSRSLRSYRLGLVLLTLLLTMPATAQAQRPDDDSPMFAADQFGVFPKTIKESLTALKERLVHGADARYEPVADYAPDSRLRLAARPVGILDIKTSAGVSTCTASLVAEDLLLTNAHCVDGGVRALRFFPDYYEAGTKPQGFEVEPTPLEFDESLDYAILRVTGTPGKTFGTLTLTARRPGPGEDLAIFHHPLGEPKSVTRFGCRVKTQQPDGRLLHVCDTMPGSSGSPILTGDMREVVALHYAGGGSPNQPVNLAISIEALSKKSAIIARLAKVAAPSPGPANDRTSAAPASGNAAPNRGYRFVNRCGEAVRFAARSRSPDSGEWTTHAWFTLQANEGTRRIANTNQYVYYVAESLDGTMTWEASDDDPDRNVKPIDGLYYTLRLADLDKTGLDVDLTCSPPDPTPRLTLINRCNKDLRVAARVMEADGEWRTTGWYELSTGERFARPTANRVGYFFAEAKDKKAAPDLEWSGGEGSNRQTLNEREVDMKRVTWDRDLWTVELTCKPK